MSWSSGKRREKGKEDVPSPSGPLTQPSSSPRLHYIPGRQEIWVTLGNSSPPLAHFIGNV